MTSCVHLESVEELVLGNITGARASELRAHLETCDECALAHVELAEERELFVRRASAVEAPPALVLPKAAPPAPTPLVLRLAQRAIGSPALAALAAAVLLFAGVARLGTSASLAVAPSESSASADVDPDSVGGADGPNVSLFTSASLSSPAGYGGSCEEEILMSRARAAMCELAVTSSTSRQ